MISRTISAFTFAAALALTAAASAVAASAAGSAADNAAVNGVSAAVDTGGGAAAAVPAAAEFPAEAGRVIVADTLRFPWPPIDSTAKAGAKDGLADTAKTAAADTAAFIDTSSVKSEAAVDTSASAPWAAGDSLERFRGKLMEAAGHKTAEDDADSDLNAAFPPGGRRIRFTDLYGGYRAEEPRGEEIRAANVSLYINYNLEDRARYIRYDHDSSSRNRDVLGRDAATLNLDGALNIRGWVFETSGRVRESYAGEEFTWENVSRDDARLVRDFVDLRSRLTVGDIAAGTSIMPGPMVGGARYERNSYFFGNDPQSDQNSVTFFMAEPGDVEVYKDGTFLRRLYLPAGHHRVGGFDGEAGRNRVRLLLRLESGATEELPFEFILSSPRVMARGDVRYAFAAGVRREYAPSPACFSYEVNEPVASVDYAYGIHHAVNAGFAAAATRHAGQGGAQVSFDVGGLGFVDARAVGSYLVSERLAGLRAEGSYTADLKRPVTRFNRFITGYPNKTPLPRMSLALRGYYQTGGYSQRMFDEQPYAGANGGAGGASGNFAAALWRGSLSAVGGVNFYRETGFETKYYPYDYNYGAKLSQDFWNTYFSVSAGERVRGGVRSPYFTLNTNHALGADVRVRSHRFSAAAGAAMDAKYKQTIADDPAVEKPDSAELDWSYGGTLGWSWSNDVIGVGSRAYAAGARFENDQAPAASATLRHAYNRARLSADYDLIGGYVGYVGRNHALRAELAGSVMFADGLWALGQQVGGGGFVLADAKGDLAGAKAYINRSPVTGGAMSRSGWLGAAYHNSVMAYRPTEFALSLTGAPEGAFLEQSMYYVTGAYKQGFALSVDGRPRVADVVEERDGGVYERPAAEAEREE